MLNRKCVRTVAVLADGGCGDGYKNADVVVVDVAADYEIEY